MLRRMAIGGTTAAMFLVLLAGCGGSSATSSPSAEASTAAETGAPTSAPASQAAQASPSVSATSASQKKVAACAGVGVRKTPGSAGVVLVRLGKGTMVRAVGTVTGDHYDATTCGTSGQEWLKVDRINGKSVKSLYGVTWGYAAAGFFK